MNKICVAVLLTTAMASGMALADNLPGLKPRLVRHAMGLADLPESLQQ